MASTTRHFVRKSHTDDGDDDDDVDYFDDAGPHKEIDDDDDDDEDDDDDADAFLEVLVLFLSRMCHKECKISLVS